MSYINVSDYKEYMRSRLPDDFEVLAVWASEQIDAATNWQLRGSLAGLDEFKSGQVKKAACIQVKWLEELGGMSALVTPAFSSVTLGKVTISMPPAAGEEPGSLCPLAKQCLFPTGLLQTGEGVE